MLQRVDQMLEPPVVGQYYMVPGVTHRFADRDGWFPVIGAKHEDREHIGFPHYHYHPDWRFMPEWAWYYSTWADEQHAFGKPLCHSGWDASRENFHDVLPFGDLTYRRRKCRRQPPENIIFPTKKGGQALHRAWAGKDARPGRYGWVCPHRGYALGSVPVNADGTITCPLHGLKFCSKTGKSVPTLPTSG